MVDIFQNFLFAFPDWPGSGKSTFLPSIRIFPKPAIAGFGVSSSNFQYQPIANLQISRKALLYQKQAYE